MLKPNSIKIVSTPTQTNFESEKLYKTVAPLSETGNEGEVIYLEDDCDGISSESDHKRRRNESENMEDTKIEENEDMTKEEIVSIGKMVKKMSRIDLEKLVLSKCVHAVVVNSELGKLREKVLQMQQNKKEVDEKMKMLAKQVNFIRNSSLINKHDFY